MKRTHGRLYSKWGVPAFDQLRLTKLQRSRYQGVMDRMNFEIEKVIRQNLDRKARQKRIQPNESALTLLLPWTPSVQSIKSSCPQASLADVAMLSVNRLVASLAVPTEVREKGNDLSRDACESSVKETFDQPSDQGTKGLITPPNTPPAEHEDQTTAAKVGGVSQGNPREMAEQPRGKDAMEAGQSFERHHMSEDMEAESCKRSFVGGQRTQKEVSSDSLFVRPNDVEAFDVLYPGQIIRRRFIAGAPPVRISTQHIRLTLSSDMFISGSEDSDDILKTVTTAEGTLHKRGDSCWVVVHRLPHGEQLKVEDLVDGSMVNLDGEGNRGTEQVLDHGAVHSSADLILARKDDVVRIRYVIGKDDIDI